MEALTTQLMSFLYDKESKIISVMLFGSVALQVLPCGRAGSSCGIAVERTPQNQEIMGSFPPGAGHLFSTLPFSISVV